MISAGQLHEITGCTPTAAALYAPFLHHYGLMYSIEMPMFIAQCAHESARLARTVENLNYSASALMLTWPNRYTIQLAKQHHRKPELIANHVYGKRMGNYLPGDGWSYRGRGLIQLTGRANYAAFERATGLPVLEGPELLEEPLGAVHSAAWFWHENNLNRYADDVVLCTRAINGGLNGLEDRRELYERAKIALSWS